MPKGVINGLLHLVPAHVGHFQALAVFREVVTEIAYLRRKQADAVNAAVLFTAGHQGLHAHADAKKRAILRDLTNQIHYPETMHFGHTVANGTNAREDDTIGFTDFFGVVGDQHGGVRGNVLNCFFGRVKIAHAVVDNGNGFHGCCGVLD